MYNVLIADDEIKICETISDYLSAKGMKTTLALNGKEAVEKVSLQSFDLIILDVMMPVLNGLEACREIRRITDIPVLFLSALCEEKDFLVGYKSGADDYIVKPFPLSVLYEKCLAMIKRYHKEDKDGKISISGITLDNAKMKVEVCGKDVKMASKDFHLLRCLMQNKGIVLEREQILVKIWGYDFDGDARVVDTHIKRIRKALGEKKDLIKTVIGTGYCFKEE